MKNKNPTMIKINTLFTLCVWTLFSQAQTPNILLIIGDDIGTDALNGYTTQNVKASTPTLDSLRNIGIAFTNAWAAPVCTPTRASIMSGKHGSKTGVYGVPGNLDTSHFSMLRKLDAENTGYAKAVIGKWHISQPTDPEHPFLHGADYYTGFMSGAPADYFAWSHTDDGNTQTNNDYVTTVFTDSAINWVGRQNEPWLLWLAHASAHTPFHVPPIHMYSINNAGQNNRRMFLAMIESLDYEINRLLTSMSTTQRENTLVIFMGDNGTPGGVLKDYPTGHAKGSVYEGGVRVPFIVAGKGVSRKGEVEPSMINVLDLHATVLEVAGVELEGGLYNSLSFTHLLTDKTGLTRNYNYIEVKQNDEYNWAIRDSQYKLIQFDDGSQQFFDLLADSFEYNPIDLNSLTAAQQSILADLETEANIRQSSWSCRDLIKNGDETGIDCGGSLCNPCTGSVGGPISGTIHIYPNPTSGIVTLSKTKENITGIKVYNAMGALILEKINHKSKEITLDFSMIQPDILVLEILTEFGTTYKKVVKW
ncbi:sulfatase-like hydrolase/transferase [Bacteroidia bacterium]|nr:sulfatase-like hydrolase/transferase [Bacteroidia bacterium]